MQADGLVRGDDAAPRRGRLNALLAIVVIAAMLVLVVWVAPLATRGVDPVSSNADGGPAVLHDDAGSVHRDAGSAVLHDDAGEVNPD
jgi:ferric-dicitrate binding protein FerR (iron transport regulator)